MDAPKLSKSLSGSRRFTSFELAAIAEIGNTTVDWILTGEERAAVSLAARAQTQESTPADSAISQALLYEDIFETLRTLGWPRQSGRFTAPRLTGSWVGQGQQLAQAARDFLKTVNVADPHLEDLPAVVEQAFGVDVAIRDLGLGIDGLSWSREDFKLALISNGVAWTRQRFTLAHELGHILAGDSQDIQVDLDVMSPTMRTQASEVRANAFAADFLMPADSPLLATGGEVTDAQFYEMLRVYGVSPSALAWRLFTLKRVDQRRRSELDSVSTRSAALQGGWVDEFQKRTSRQSATRLPHLLAQQAFNAYSAGAIGARPLAAVLNVPVDSLLPTPVVAPIPGLSPVEDPVFSP